MFSFSTISVFATLAFGALSSAIPLSVPVVGDFPVPAALPVSGLVGRDGAVGVAVILTTATQQLAPFTAQLKFVNAQNATVDAVTVPVGHIKDILTATVVQLNALVGKPTEIILASVEGTALITVAELGKIVAGLVIIVFEALGAVLTVAGAAVDHVLFDLLATVGVVVGSLLVIVFKLVGGIVGDLLAVLVPLLRTVVPFILHLNIATVISLLKLHA